MTVGTGTAARTATIAGVWRHPVKSMAPEALAEAAVSVDGGVLGDRAWALRDERRGVIADARTLPALLDVSARYVRPATAAEPGPPVEITVPGHAPVSSADPDVHGRLSAALGREVTLWPWLPAGEDAHYRRVPPEDGDWDRYLREFFDVADAADVPDLSRLPAEVTAYQTIPGTYFDAYPIHLITDVTLRALGGLTGGGPAGVRRFRPNLLLSVPDGADGPVEPYPELAWAGRRLRAGTAVLRVTVPTPRCVMITHAAGGLPRDRDLLRAVHRRAEHNAGVYAAVEEPGVLRPGDRVELLP
ncbi:MOSC domain-containing protein [Actinomadura sp. NTSP31]|uniref:MOSC domain-containing protein n=1 Tax=Actinomadura sp. NTSP31 TaxID=1735447 RepID=UPI0035C04500